MQINDTESCLEYLSYKKQQFESNKYTGVKLTEAFDKMCKTLAEVARSNKLILGDSIKYLHYFIVGAEVMEALAKRLVNYCDEQSNIACSMPQLVTSKSHTTLNIKAVMLAIERMLPKQRILLFIIKGNKARQAASEDVVKCLSKMIKYVRVQPAFQERQEQQYKEMFDNWNPDLDNNAAKLDLAYLLWTKHNMPYIKNKYARLAMKKRDDQAMHEHPYLIMQEKPKGKNAICIIKGMKIVKTVLTDKMLKASNAPELLHHVAVSKMRGKSIMNRNVFYGHLYMISLDKVK